ncbi:MAG: hypothetical protein ABJO29_02700 [Yoonia sp.]|uniref:hypothetical protein n=1 Tax=Yoonia sp. TaxID=2212373 RepID=UPI0032661227
MKYIALAASLFASPVVAQDFVAATYAAHISADDLTNSSGARLGDAASVIRQDRANYHRFGLADGADSNDPLFGSADARANIPAMIRAAGGIAPDVAEWIMRGNVTVYINILSDGDDFTGLQVLMAG